MSQEASSTTAPEHPADAAQQKREQELQRALTTFKDGRINRAIGICRDLLAKTLDLAGAACYSSQLFWLG
jgi:hypothetical protein